MTQASKITIEMLTLSRPRFGLPPESVDTSRIPTRCQWNPRLLKPELRKGLKQRQNALLRQKLEDRQRQWAEWEGNVEQEEKSRREAREQLSRQRYAIDTQRQQFPPSITNYQESYQASEQSRLSREDELDDVRRRLQDRVKRRQLRSDRWTPPESTEQAAQRAREAMRQSRLRQKEAREASEAADMAAAATFLEGRVRQKASKFSQLVEDIQRAQEIREQQDGLVSRNDIEGGDDGQGGFYSRGRSRSQRSDGLPTDVVRVVRNQEERANKEAASFRTGPGIEPVKITDGSNLPPRRSSPSMQYSRDVDRTASDDEYVDW